MKKFIIEFKWGIIFTIVTIIWHILEKSAGLHDQHIDKHAIYTNLFSIVAIAVFIIALIDKKKNYYQGNMNWTQGFLSGMLISVVVAALSPLVTYICFTYISPQFFDNVIRYAVDNNKQTQEQAEAYFNFNTYLLMGAVGALSFGVVTSAIVSLIVKSKHKPQYEV